MILINCIYNEDGAWCTNAKVKASLWGFGARCCVEYPPSDRVCEFKEAHRPPANMPPAAAKATP